MSQQNDESFDPAAADLPAAGQSDGGTPGGADTSRATGHPEVDAVLSSMEGLAERPPAEQVAVFDSAHERLRSALADAGDDQEPAP